MTGCAGVAGVVGAATLEVVVAAWVGVVTPATLDTLVKIEGGSLAGIHVSPDSATNSVCCMTYQTPHVDSVQYCPNALEPQSARAGGSRISGL